MINIVHRQFYSSMYSELQLVVNMNYNRFSSVTKPSCLSLSIDLIVGIVVFMNTVNLANREDLVLHQSVDWLRRSSPK